MKELNIPYPHLAQSLNTGVAKKIKSLNLA